MTIAPPELAPGRYEGIHIDAYHRELPGVSKTRLDWIHRSPEHFQEFLKRPPQPTNAMNFGNAFHAALLEPTRFLREYAIRPDCRKGSKEHVAWQARHPDVIEIIHKEGLLLHGMLGSARSLDLVHYMLHQGAIEVTYLWKDQRTGELCKCRPDVYLAPDGVVVDVKSAADASEAEFARQTHNLRYHVSAALTTDGMNAVLGDGAVVSFVCLVIEKAPPYVVQAYELGPDQLALGRQEYREDLATLAECRRIGRWPGYGDGTIRPLPLVPWAAKRIRMVEQT